MALLFACSNPTSEVTPMMLAARTGDSGEVQRLIDEGNTVNELSRYGWTALMFAAWKGHQDAATKLLDAGADPNVKSEFIHFSFMSTGGNYAESTALREAIRGKHFAIVDLLLEHGARIDSEALMRAGEYGDPSLLSRLQRGGVSFRNEEIHGVVMLAACDRCNLDVVRWLLQNGAGPNGEYHGRTALGVAVDNDCPKVVRYLLRSGADPNLAFGSPGDKKTALFVAVQKHTQTVNFEKNLAVVSSLLSHGADLSFRSASDPRSLLQIAEEDRTRTQQHLDDSKTRDVIRAQSTKRLVYEEKLIRLLKR